MFSHKLTFQYVYIFHNSEGTVRVNWLTNGTESLAMCSLQRLWEHWTAVSTDNLTLALSIIHALQFAQQTEMLASDKVQALSHQIAKKFTRGLLQAYTLPHYIAWKCLKVFYISIGSYLIDTRLVWFFSQVSKTYYVNILCKILY